MGRLIDADALMEKFQNTNANGINLELDKYALKCIKDAPTIEERKTGTWCVTPDGKLVCSNCYNNPTNRIIVDGSLIYDMTPIRKRMKFCPSCGASMTEGKYDEINRQ